MKNLNLPNLLTIIRILALPFCAYALFKNGGDDSTWRIIAWVLFFLVGMTDSLDGKIARSRNQITPLGIFLDPIADKAFIGTALIGLSILGDMPWWVTIFILVREILVTLLRLVVIKRGVIPASKGGKIKTLTQNFSIGFYVLPLPSFLYLPRDIFLGVALILTLVTGLDYLKKAVTK
ncbi:MAG: CDP-diacylglycerol--glycerol-3-phosphate 3-phosphatidyltransferase [Actinobacteria bacterium]|nr:CDP-diacylglycerol--glycerol-3-phosphate 3-phosphatidyltransferase [Actinomycetota bacterium]